MAESWEEAVERLVAGAVEQGFGRYITDEAFLDRLAAAIVRHERDADEPRREVS
jgi:hypothetical protein